MSMTSELIDRLRKNVNWLDEEDNDEREIRKSMLEAADTIRLLSKKLCASQMERSSQYYNDGWIPVEETDELPKEEVLCINKYGETMYGLLKRSSMLRKPDNLMTYYAKNMDCIMADCVAWSPLKKYQPKEGELMNANWISVEDRVPETDDYVLAWNGQPIVAYYDGEWYSTDGNFDEDISPITYWMPLPEEPKEGE